MRKQLFTILDEFFIAEMARLTGGRLLIAWRVDSRLSGARVRALPS